MKQSFLFLLLQHRKVNLLSMVIKMPIFLCNRPQNPGRTSHSHHIGRNIFGNHTACTNDRILPDGNSTITGILSEPHNERSK